MNFKAGNRQIDATCAAITETSLLLIEKKRQYDHREFTLCQADHHAAVRAPGLPEQPLPAMQIFAFFCCNNRC